MSRPVENTGRVLVQGSGSDSGVSARHATWALCHRVLGDEGVDASRSGPWPPRWGTAMPAPPAPRRCPHVLVNEFTQLGELGLVGRVVGLADAEYGESDVAAAPGEADSGWAGQQLGPKG
jgi:hypothetical protein